MYSIGHHFVFKVKIWFSFWCFRSNGSVFQIGNDWPNHGLQRPLRPLRPSTFVGCWQRIVPEQKDYKIINTQISKIEKKLRTLRPCSPPFRQWSADEQLLFISAWQSLCTNTKDTVNNTHTHTHTHTHRQTQKKTIPVH